MKVQCIIIAGGSHYTVEIIFGDLQNRQLPPLWTRLMAGSLMALHDGEILLFGGGPGQCKQDCYKLRKGFSRQNVHSILTDNFRSSAVTVETGTFVFGGKPNIHGRPTTYEYLPKGSTTWQKGKTPIPEYFYKGSAIAVKSGQEILLIGGLGTERRILSFDVNDHSFKELSTKLNEERWGHNCAYIPGTNKVMITGGFGEGFEGDGWLNSTEILDSEDGSITRGSPMNSKRCNHGIGVITINGTDRLAVFGGSSLGPSDYENHCNIHGYVDPDYFNESVDSIEVYNSTTKTWETTDMKLKHPNSSFAYLSVRLGDIIQKL